MHGHAKPTVFRTSIIPHLMRYLLRGKACDVPMSKTVHGNTSPFFCNWNLCRTGDETLSTAEEQIKMWPTIHRIYTNPGCRASVCSMAAPSLVGHGNWDRIDPLSRLCIVDSKSIHIHGPIDATRSAVAFQYIHARRFNWGWLYRAQREA